MGNGAIHECMDTLYINNIQGVCINTCSKYPCMLLLYRLIVDLYSFNQLLCWMCNALKK